jgi:hypothetical protein
MESEGERRDRQIVEMRTSGKSEAEVARLLNCSKADVRLVVDAEAVATLSAANRVRMIYLESQRLDELQEVFHKQAKAGDVARGALVVKLMERRATLIGLNAPLRIDPIQLAESAQPKLTSTGELLDAINRLRAGDKRRKMNGGPGYGDERDDEDVELIRMRERNDFVDGGDAAEEK